MNLSKELLKFRCKLNKCLNAFNENFWLQICANRKIDEIRKKKFFFFFAAAIFAKFHIVK